MAAPNDSAPRAPGNAMSPSTYRIKSFYERAIYTSSVPEEAKLG
jgi:hypothetical protein